MRRVVIGVAAAAALAWAQGARADHHTEKAQKEKAEGMKPSGGAAGGSSGMGTGSGAPSAPGARHPGSDSATATQDSRAGASAERQADKKHPLFEGKKNFDVEGKVSRASSDEVTIERKDGLPPATLKVGSGTKIQVDGQQASAAQLQAGQDVKASFNLRGDSPEAVEVKAKKAEASDRKEMQEQRREGQQERAKDRQQQR